MTLKGCINWKGLGSSPELTGIIYTLELKSEVYRLNKDSTFVILRIRKCEQNLIFLVNSDIYKLKRILK